MSSFTEMITAAYKEEETAKAEAAKAEAAKVQINIAKALASLGITKDYTQTGELVEFEDLTIKAEFEYSYIRFKVQGECPECGRLCWSNAISNLAGIGKMYIEFDPGYNHRCDPIESKALTPVEALSKAIAGLIDDKFDDIIEENL